MSKIIIVDDEQPVRKMLRNMIRNDSDEILEAENGIQALELCNESNIDLIITDIVMPEMNGIDLIMEVKNRFPQISIIAISGGGGISGRYNYLDIAELLGSKSILSKPFESSELRDQVKKALNTQP